MKMDKPHQIRSLIFLLLNDISKETHQISEADIQRCPDSVLESLAMLNRVRMTLLLVSGGDDIRKETEE